MNKIIAVARWLYALFYAYTGASWFSYKLFGTAWPDHEEAPATKALTTALTARTVDRRLYMDSSRLPSCF